MQEAGDEGAEPHTKNTSLEIEKVPASREKKKRGEKYRPSGDLGGKSQRKKNHPERRQREK